MRLGFLMPNSGKARSPVEIKQSTLSKDSGHNVGNWAFWNAAQLLFKEKSRCFIPLQPDNMNAQYYSDKIDMLIIPAANWIQVPPDFSWLADFIEELDKPCLMFGLGAQSSDISSIPALSEEKGIVRMLRAVSQRTPWIGVRGSYTQKVCESYGISNIKPMGCASLFTNNNERLGVLIEKDWSRYQEGRIAIHSAANASVDKDILKKLERYLFKYAIEHPGSHYILQGRQFWKLVFQSQWPEREYATIKAMVSVFDDTMAPEDFAAFFRKYTHIPYCVNSWMNFIQYHSCSLGSRIHGSILALSAQRPTVCITIDTRTQELCDLLKVPNISCNEIDFDQSPIDIFEAHRIEGIAFDENRRRLLAMYQELLGEVGLEISDYSKNILKNQASN